MTEKEKAIKILKKLQEAGHVAVFAGGCVRDMLLGIEPNDYDIATSATPDEVLRFYPKADLVGASFGVVIVNHIEVATFRTDSDSTDGRRPDEVVFSRSMKEDSNRRDFTINAMYFDPLCNVLFDFHGGEEDVERGMIKAVGKPEDRFKQDYLRIMRAFRFSLKYKMRIDKKTAVEMIYNMKGLKEISAERVTEELLKMFSLPGRVNTYLTLKELWKVVIPEVHAIRGVEQGSNWHSEGDVHTHTMMAIEELEKMEVSDPINYIAVMLHDIGKPATAFRKSPTSVSFHGHEKLGTKMAKDILERMKFSKNDIERILFSIEKHMIMHQFLSLRTAKQKRLYHERHFNDLWLLSRADSRAAIADSDEKNRMEDTILENIQKRIDEFDAYEAPIVTGLDLIVLGMKPGPIFKEALSEVYDAQLEGENNKTELLKIASKFIV